MIAEHTSSLCAAFIKNDCYGTTNELLEEKYFRVSDTFWFC